MKKRKNIFWGILLIAGAIFIIANSLGYMEDVNAFKVVVGVVLAGIFVENIVRVNFAGILFSAAVFCIVFDSELGIEAITPWPVLATALLGTIGLQLLFGSSQIKKKNKNYFDTQDINVQDGEYTMYATRFGDVTKHVNTDSFKEANFDCKFGSLRVYLDNAVMKKDNATVYVDVAFGDMQLYIPRTWRVEQKVHTAFGDVKVQANNYPGEITHTLCIKGNVSFGDLKISYI